MFATLAIALLGGSDPQRHALRASRARAQSDERGRARAPRRAQASHARHRLHDRHDELVHRARRAHRRHQGIGASARLGDAVSTSRVRRDDDRDRLRVRAQRGRRLRDHGSSGAEGGDDDKFFGSVVNGLFAALMSTPCSAPFLGTAVAFALGADVPAWKTILIFAMIGLGLALPYLAITLIPGFSKFFRSPAAGWRR